MRQLSKRTQYSLRALYALARGYGRGPILISQLAEEEAIPKKFLEQILLSLKTRGMVSSKPGRGGGYTLAQPPSQITLASVIRMIDGPLAPLPCASETRFRKCDECADIDTCGTRMVMKEVRDAVAEILERTTLASVCRQVDAARQKQQDPKLLAYEI
ncbi:MAG TPA: Rrf2 family transcriptional regulator [Bryobacteraceae bacterium]|nr:Rrf2 family transcriptional regulator [Bryobacteraceae bacterium]